MKHQIEVIEGDITCQQVDAIVNAANESLLGGGGVDGAIHRAAGSQLLAECRTLQGCKTGDAKLTSGYELPARWVIHTVGPVWHGGTQGEAGLLARCYHSVFSVVRSQGILSLAFPAISCGVYGYPAEQAVKIAVTTVNAELAGFDEPLRVLFCCFDPKMAALYREELQN